MARYCGDTDEIALGVQTDIDTESVAYGDEEDLDVMKFSWILDNKAEAVLSADGGFKSSKHIDKVAGPSGSLSARVVGPRILKASFGSLTDSSPDFTATTTSGLPFHSVKAAFDGTNMLKFRGIKLNGCRLSFADRDSPLMFDADWLGKHMAYITPAAINGTEPSNKPIMAYDIIVKVNGSSIGVANAMNVNVNRDIEQLRGAEDMGADDKRLFSDIKEKKLKIDYDIDVVIEDATILNKALGGTSITSSGRSEDTITLKCNPDDGTGRNFDIDLLNCSNSKGEGGILEEMGERIFKLTGTARNISADGTYET